MDSAIDPNGLVGRLAVRHPQNLQRTALNRFADFLLTAEARIGFGEVIHVVVDVGEAMISCPSHRVTWIEENLIKIDCKLNFC